MSMINELRRMHRTEAGVVLPLVLVFLALGMLLITPTLGLGSTSLEGTMVAETKALELYAADAGVEDAMHWLLHGDRNDGKYISEEQGIWSAATNQPLVLNGAEVKTSITEQGGDQFIIVSEATSSVSSHTVIKALIQFYEGQLEQGGGNIFSNAITALGGDVTIAGSGNLKGDIFAFGNLNKKDSSGDIIGEVYGGLGIQITGSGKIYGDAYTHGEIDHPEKVTGESQTGIPPRSAPSLTEDELNTLITSVQHSTEMSGFSAGPITRSGTWIVPSGTYTTAEHIAGNATISTSKKVTFNGPFVVDGNLSISGSGDVVFEGPVAVGGDFKKTPEGTTGSGDVVFEGPVVIGRDLSIKGSGDVVFEGPVAVGGDFEATGSGQVQIEDNVYVGGDLTLTGSKNEFVNAPVIVAMGDIKLSGSGSLLSGSKVPLVVTPTGDFSLTGSGDIWAAIYAPAASVELKGSGTIYGAIVCSSFEIPKGASGTVQYLAELGERSDLPGNYSETVRPRTVKVITYEIS